MAHDPAILGFCMALIILDSIFLGFVTSVTVNGKATTTPAIFNPAMTETFNISLANQSIANASSLGVGLTEAGLFFDTSTGHWVNNGNGGWTNTGTDDKLFFVNLHVNGFGQYDNTYYLSNPNNVNFDVFISVEAPQNSVSTGALLAKEVWLQVRGNTFTVPTATVGGVFAAFINNDKTTSASYDINNFVIRTVYNENTSQADIYLNGVNLISGTNLGTGVIYVGERKYGGLEVYGPGLILFGAGGQATTMSTQWYGDPITGFLLAAWNFFQTMFAFFVWDFSFPAEWSLVFNAIYMVGVRVPAYIAMFIGIRLLRGTG